MFLDVGVSVAVQYPPYRCPNGVVAMQLRYSCVERTSFHLSYRLALTTPLQCTRDSREIGKMEIFILEVVIYVGS